MPEVASSGRFELAVEARNDQYRSDDDRWRAQVATLHQDLHAQVDTVERGHPVTGAKGTLDQLVIALGSAGAFTAALDCFRAWLQRDKGRRIDVRWDEDGVERYVTFTGDAVDADSVRVIAEAAAKRVGGQAWAAATEPS